MSSLPDRREASSPIDPIFVDRWSPRAFTAEELPRADLEKMFEAARWAPSTNNSQPWRFLYALRGGKGWELLVDLLLPGNQAWAPSAAALVVVLSQTSAPVPGTDEVRTLGNHAFDAGAAWMSFALQAFKLGWHTHPMAGFDKARAPEALGLPANVVPHAFIAVGRIGDAGTLPEKLRAREIPSQRRPLSETVFEGRYPG